MGPSGIRIRPHLISALHPPAWNGIRWVLLPIACIGLIAAGAFYLPVIWKERRDKAFRTFWEDFRLSG